MSYRIIGHHTAPINQQFYHLVASQAILAKSQYGPLVFWATPMPASPFMLLNSALTPH